MEDCDCENLKDSGESVSENNLPDSLDVGIDKLTIHAKVCCVLSILIGVFNIGNVISYHGTITPLHITSEFTNCILIIFLLCRVFTNYVPFQLVITIVVLC